MGNGAFADTRLVMGSLVLYIGADTPIADIAITITALALASATATTATTATAATLWIFDQITLDP